MPSLIALLLLPWVVIILVSTISAWRYSWGLPRPEMPVEQPRIAVIVAVKGATAATRQFFGRLLDQAYADYHIIASVESRRDPACALVEELAPASAGKLSLVIAGEAVRSGQKVANLLAALDRLSPEDAIIVFTDADTLPQPQWLGRLAAALLDAGHTAVTGYRWMVPTDGRLSSAVVAAANTSVVTLPRISFALNLCWGGTIALKRETLERIDIRKYWAGAILDDLPMTRALWDHGIGIAAPRQSLLLSPVSFDWRSAFAFGQRQYRLVFIHTPLIWVIAVAITLTPIASASFALALAARGDLAAWAILVLAVVAGEIRYRCRRRIAAAIWGAEAAGLTTAVDRWLRPLWWAFHALCVLAAPGSRHIRWAGIDYFVRAPQDVEVVTRAEGTVSSASN